MPDASERIAELQREVASNPASRQFYQLGELLRRDGRADEAVLALRTGLVHHPRYVAAWVSLGRALIELTEAAAAAKVLQRAIELDTQNPVAWRLLGESRLMQGNRLGALSAMQKALELAPGDEMVTAAVEALAGETLPPGSFADVDVRRKEPKVDAAARPVAREEAPLPAAAVFLAPAPAVERAVVDVPAAVPAPEEAVVEAPAAVPASGEAVVEAAPFESVARADAAFATAAAPLLPDDPFALEAPPVAALEDVFAAPLPPVAAEPEPLAAAAPVFEEPMAVAEELMAVAEAPAAALVEPAAVEAEAPAAETVEAVAAPPVEEVAPPAEEAWDFEPSPEPELRPVEVSLGAEEIVEVEEPVAAPELAEAEEPAAPSPAVPVAAAEPHRAGPVRQELQIARPTVTLARLCIQQEDFSTAVAILEKIIDQQPANQEARDLLDLLRDMMDAGTVEELRPLTVRERKVAALQRWLASLTLGRERWLS